MMHDLARAPYINWLLPLCIFVGLALIGGVVAEVFKKKVCTLPGGGGCTFPGCVLGGRCALPHGAGCALGGGIHLVATHVPVCVAIHLPVCGFTSHAGWQSSAQVSYVVIAAQIGGLC
jgi:hypothetical protein